MRGAKIGKGARLLGCIVGPGAAVEAETQAEAILFALDPEGGGTTLTRISR